MANAKSRKKKITEKRRGQILKAALEIFTQKGYAAATIPEISKAAGVAAGTIYLYYPSKRELFISVIKDFIVTAPLLNLIDKIPKGDITKILENILQDRLDLIKNEVFTRLPSLMGEVLHDPELKDLWLKEFLHPFLGRIEMGYRMMAVAGKFRRMEPAVAVRAVGGMILGFLMLRVMEGDTSPLDRIEQEKIADDIVNLLLHGLLKEPKGELK
ncbi:MAG: TetR/AcrR family transcriptional regulator [Dehalococcoidales bacterium]